MNKFIQTTSLLTAGLLLSALTAQAQLTWDPDANFINDGGAGTWDLATTNWDDDGSTPNVLWVDGNNATFGSGSYQVDLTSVGVTVGDLTYGGGGTLLFKGSSLAGVAGDAITVNPGATWDTGGGSISFFNTANNNNTRLVMASGTLSVTGGGTLSASDNPQNNAFGTWDVGTATLDVTQAMTVRGDSLTFGAFDTIKMVDGSRYVHDRNSDRTYTNAWELGGTVTFDNKWARNYVLSGAITGVGGMKVNFLGNRIITLTNDTNSFSGGIEIASGGRLQVANKERLGDVANNITLSDGGILRAQGVDFGSTRDIILSGTGGSIINDGAVNTFGGKITGDGDLQIGNAAYNTLSNRFVLTSSTSDYTGNTTIHNGSIELGADNALPSSAVLTIGGNNSTAQMFMEGFDLEIAGLVSTGNNTKQFSSTAASILTINVADGETHSYNGNVVGTAGNVSIVKAGLGTQNFNRGAGVTSDIGDISVNAGTLLWDINGNTGAVSVASGATLLIGNSGNSGGVGTGVGAANAGDTNITNEGSVSILRSAAFAYDGVISGSGDVTYSAGNGALTLSQVQTYTGNTSLDKAVFVAQMANALSADSAVSVGGAGSGTSAFDMNGFDQEIGGFTFGAGGHTRELRNNGADATLTLNVATGESYAYAANVTGSGTIDLVKSGEGSQTMSRVSGGYSTPLGDLTVTAGELVWSNLLPATLTGAVNVTGGNLELTKSLSVTDFTVGTGATSSFVFEVTDWNGVAQTDFNQVAASGAFSVADAASYTVVVDDANLAGFVDSTKSFIIATAPTMSATTAEFVLDATAFTLGSGGTWSLDVVGTDVVLTFNSTVASGYGTWAGDNSLTSGVNDGETDDPDFDGIENVLEYILGGDPLAADVSISPEGVINGANYELTFKRSDDSEGDATASVEFGSDLTVFPTATEVVPTSSGTVGSVTFTITENGTDADDVTASIPHGGATEFFGRVSGSLNP